MILPEWSYHCALYKPGSFRYLTNGDLFYECISEREYTKFGNWLKRVPGIISLPILVPYYLVVWPIWAIYTFTNEVLTMVIGLLFTPIIKDE